MVKLAERLLRRNPSEVTILSPLVTYLFTFSSCPYPALEKGKIPRNHFKKAAGAVGARPLGQGGPALFGSPARPGRGI